MPREPVDPFARDLIRRKARRLVGRAGIKAQDRQDLEQELVAGLLRRLPDRVPCRPHDEALVTTAVEQIAANLLRRLQAAKRGGSPASLSTVVPTADGPAERAAAVGGAERDARRGVRPRTDQDLADLAADVASVLAGLPAGRRAGAVRLMTGTVAEAARDLGVPRTTLHEKVRRLRRPFERAGLKDYLEDSPSCRRETGLM